MKRTGIACVLGLFLVLSGIPATQAQDEGNAPPVITNVTWEIEEYVGASGSLYLYLNPVAFDPDSDLASERDILIATLTITDADWTGAADDTDQEPVFIRQRAYWFPLVDYPSPEPGPFLECDRLFQPREGDGFAPGVGQTTLTISLEFTIPEWVGKNQARLRGDVTWDVRWLVELGVSNNQDPDCQDSASANAFVPGGCGADVTFDYQLLYAVANSVLDTGGNPPAFADAGIDMVVAAGTTVELDGSQTYDGYNIGFDALDPNVFEKDRIEYSWEWITGPEPVEPKYPDPTNKPAVAEVTLNAVGTYTYRLTVDDGVNSLPTTDTVTVEVVSTIPENRAPTATIVGPTAAVLVGQVLMLDGTVSSDPDGDELTFRWRQTDELGGNLTIEDATRLFQPLGGLEAPISAWQATQEGTYYFRLIVTDPSGMMDTKTTSVLVMEAGTAGVTISQDSADEKTSGDGGNLGDDGMQQPATAACGGSLLPLAALPVMLSLMRGRKRW